MAELKTKPNDQDVESFLDGIPDDKKRQSCLYIKKIEDIDVATLKQLIEQSVKHMRRLDRTEEDV